MKVPNKYRIKSGEMRSTDKDGNNGAFLIPFETFFLVVISSDGFGWEHVSVSLKKRTPNWREMCFIKDLFWGDDECVIQFHPKKSNYVNNCQTCLHLWRKIGDNMDTPPLSLV